jgi:hypothetical protein
MLLQRRGPILLQSDIACFTRGHPETASEPNPFSSKHGFAMDRMWAQYAECHSGVCLVFDRDELAANARRALEGRGRLLADNVTYSDAPRFRLMDLDSVHLRGPDRSAAAFRKSVLRERFFTKREDWSGEWEYRIVLLDATTSSQHQFIPIVSSLVGIFVADRIREACRSAIERICRQKRIRLDLISFELGCSQEALVP